MPRRHPSLQGTPEDQSEGSLPSFTSLESRVFSIGNDGRLFLGREEIRPETRSVLRDEARNLKSSRLWEILNASVTNEAYVLSLIQSKNFEEVMSAKMLHHWAHHMRNVIDMLAK